MTASAPLSVHERFSATPNPQTSKTLRASGQGQGLQQTTVQVREFTFTADEPEAIGGRNAGPTPMEYLAGAVNSCITVVVDQLAARTDFPLTGVQTYTLARQDTRGLAGLADVQPYVYAYRLQLVVATPERDHTRLQRFAQNAEHICPAINLLRDAHTGLEVVWSFVSALTPGAAEYLANTAWDYASDGIAAPAPHTTITNADLAGQQEGTDV